MSDIIQGPDDLPTNLIIDFEKAWTVSLSEQEIDVLGASLSRYFNICTGMKSPIPVGHAVILMDLLKKLKRAQTKNKAITVRKETD